MIGRLHVQHDVANDTQPTFNKINSLIDMMCHVTCRIMWYTNKYITQKCSLTSIFLKGTDVQYLAPPFQRSNLNLNFLCTYLAL